MLKSANKNLSELIVEALAGGPNQTLEDLRKKVRLREEADVTVQAWYKALARLYEEGVIVKHKKRYSLNTSWIIDVVNLSELMRKEYLEESPGLVLPKNPKESNIYNFKNLISMNSFWAHALVEIASDAKSDKTLYIYNPHFWFYMAHGEVEEQYSRSMKDLGVEIYLIVGSNSFLDKWNSKFFEENVKHWLSPSPIYPETHKYYNALGDYFIEVTLPEGVASEIEQIFRVTKSLSEVSQLGLIDVFQRKASCKMKITKNLKKSKAFKKKIKSYFE